MHTTIMISEKCAFEGTTRFEDGLRLPLGISVNFPSFAAGILTEVCRPATRHTAVRMLSYAAVFNRAESSWSFTVSLFCGRAGGVQPQGAAAVQPPGRDRRDARAGRLLPGSTRRAPQLLGAAGSERLSGLWEVLPTLVAMLLSTECIYAKSHIPNLTVSRHTMDICVPHESAILVTRLTIARCMRCSGGRSAWGRCCWGTWRCPPPWTSSFPSW
jgi:hypothetical protein